MEKKNFDDIAENYKAKEQQLVCACVFSIFFILLIFNSTLDLIS